MRIIAIIGAVFALVAAGAAISSPTQHAHVVQAKYQGKTIKWWAHRTVVARTQANTQRLELRVAHARLQARVVSLENVYEHAARVAAVAFDSMPGLLPVSSDTLIRKGRCESVNWTKFHNKSGAAGPWQFLGSTWASTPFAGFSVYDPVAAALAAAWMHAHGRGGEWVCQ